MDDDDVLVQYYKRKKADPDRYSQDSQNRSKLTTIHGNSSIYRSAEFACPFLSQLEN